MNLIEKTITVTFIFSQWRKIFPLITVNGICDGHDDNVICDRFYKVYANIKCDGVHYMYVYIKCDEISFIYLYVTSDNIHHI